MFFVLHGVNLHFGLIPIGEVGTLFLVYAAITVAVGFITKVLLKEKDRSILFVFVVLSTFFLFGAVKDFLENNVLTKALSSYRILLPAVSLMLVFTFVLLVYKKKSWKVPGRYISTLLCIFVAYELLFLLYNVVTRDNNPDFGDKDRTLIAGKRIPLRSTRPDIFWIVMDEYSASASLLRKWHFRNPLDSVLTNKKFFVADSATSPYNFTHYSMDAMLDMMYLPSLKEGDVVRFEHMVLGDQSVYENNVVDFLQKNGYAVRNYTMFDMQGMPAHPYIRFMSQPGRLISDNTLYARVKKDIGWNFTNLFKENKNRADSNERTKSFRKLADQQSALTQLYQKQIEHGASSDRPVFYMMQMMLTHEPFLYNSDGSLHAQASFTNSAAYISSVEYANKVIVDLCDRIINTHRSRNFIIIFQSDHGFKFDESDPYFSESCRIPFAVYASDQNYDGWQRDINGVNVFRILFNKYFDTGFPLLDTRTHILRYRE